MRLTTKGRYAVTAILDLALHSAERPVTLADVAGRQGISLSYLEQLFARLRRFSLVASVRGPGGGYVLAREPSQISIAQVITAVDESLDARRCRGESNCKDGRPCLTHGLWEDLSGRIIEHLESISVENLMNRQSVRRVAQRQDSASESFGASCAVRRPFHGGADRTAHEVPLE